MKELPVFKYHPDPIKTGMVVKTDKACECCGQVAGYTYAKKMYCRQRPEVICPWCIADGSAAEKFSGSFAEGCSLDNIGLDDSILVELSTRNPGYISWQDMDWRACCGDACEFHGDETRAYLLGLDEAGLETLSKETEFTRDDLRDIIPHYQPGGSPAFYRFLCRHCGAIHHHADFH
jgi:uncharacterized protein CbrC (UPF0167 family)